MVLPGPLSAGRGRRAKGRLNAGNLRRRDDDAIQEEIRSLIGDLLHLADVGLRVDRGVVGIRGRTRSRGEAEAIKKAVAGVRGVVSVRGQIECREVSAAPR
jgi:osmotically-inducible protein OsmY